MSETEEGGRERETPRLSLSREQHSGLFERVRALFGLAPASARDDIEDALEDSAIEEFTPQERAILKNVLTLHDVRVEDVMVPRADIVALALDTPLRKVLDCFRTAGHSRLPVYEETLDDPRGMIHIRDFVVFLASDPRFGLMSGPRPGRTAATARPNSTCRSRRRESCGRFSTPLRRCPRSTFCSRCRPPTRIWRWSSTNTAARTGSSRSRTSWNRSSATSRMSTTRTRRRNCTRRRTAASSPRPALRYDAVSEAVGFDFASLGEAEGVDTIGGLVTAAAGRVPDRGEILKGPGQFEFEVLDADPRRVKRLKIRPLPARSAKPPASPPAANAKPGDQA